MSKNQRILLASRPHGAPTPDNFNLDEADIPTPGPDRLPGLMRKILTKSLTIRGFIQFEFAAQRPDFYRDMTSWISTGAIRYREHITPGLTNAPTALIGLLQGQNFGKLIIHVADPV